MFKLSLKSMLNRKFTSALCVFSIAISIALLLGVERIRKSAKEGFANTISGVDLLVGSRGSPLELLLYSVFHIGKPISNIRYSTFEKINNSAAVKWTIPISLGDAYKGFRVVGTNDNFFQHFKYRGEQVLKFQTGKKFNGIFDVVLGAQVAKKLGHKVGDSIILSHGIQEGSLLEHDDSPFKVVGILQSTTTPVDKAVYISLEGMEAMHFGWENGVPSEDEYDKTQLTKEDIEIKQITSFLVRAKSRIAILRLQRSIINFPDEPIMGLIPAFTLINLWESMSFLENVLLLISSLVLLVGFFSIIIALYTSLNERRREMAILRAIGAAPRHIFSLLFFESFFLSVSAVFLGISSLFFFGQFFKEVLATKFSVYLEIAFLKQNELPLVGLVLLVSVVISLLPAFKAYRNSLSDGLQIKT